MDWCINIGQSGNPNHTSPILWSSEESELDSWEVLPVEMNSLAVIELLIYFLTSTKRHQYIFFQAFAGT